MKTFLTALTLASLICGCAHDPDPAVRRAGEGPYVGADPLQRENYVALDRRVERSIRCSRIQKRNLEDGRMEVTAMIQNLENRRLEVQVNCVFKDDQWFPTGDEAPFQTLILSENAVESIRFASMNERAKNFTIRIRQAR